jgi:hypothetical protein
MALKSETRAAVPFHESCSWRAMKDPIILPDSERSAGGRFALALSHDVSNDDRLAYHHSVLER